MRKYEAACVFRVGGEEFARGKEAVKKALSGLGAQITGENDMNQRTLAYPIKDETQGHYLIFEVDMDPDAAHKAEDSVKLLDDLLRFMMIRKED